MQYGSARRDDWDTSKAAAAANQAGREGHCNTILALFRDHGSMTHNELARYTYQFTKDHRRRTKDLENRGFVRMLSVPRLGTSGLANKVWEITPEGLDHLKEKGL